MLISSSSDMQTAINATLSSHLEWSLVHHCIFARAFRTRYRKEVLTRDYSLALSGVIGSVLNGAVLVWLVLVGAGST